MRTRTAESRPRPDIRQRPAHRLDLARTGPRDVSPSGARVSRPGPAEPDPPPVGLGSRLRFEQPAAVIGADVEATPLPGAAPCRIVSVAELRRAAAAELGGTPRNRHHRLGAFVGALTLLTSCAAFGRARAFSPSCASTARPRPPSTGAGSPEKVDLGLRATG